MSPKFVTRKAETIAILAADTPLAHRAERELVQKYKHTDPEKADVIIALGGDGHMLEVMHKMMHLKKPIYGLNLDRLDFC
jgi:NAD+ kinase